MWYICVCVHTHTMEYSSAIKEWNNAICSNMDGATEYYPKPSKPDTNTIWYPLFVKSKEMIQISIFTKQKPTHRHRKQTTAIKGEMELWINYKFVFNKHTSLYIKQTNNRDLLNSTGNYIQCIAITYKCRVWKRKNIYNTIIFLYTWN